MLSFLKNIRIKKDEKSNKRYFCIANDAIYVDELVNAKRRDTTVVTTGEENQQQFQQEFDDESSWGI